MAHISPLLDLVLVNGNKEVARQGAMLCMTHAVTAQWEGCCSGSE